MKKTWLVILLFVVIFSFFTSNVRGESGGIILSGYDVKVIKDADYILSGNIILRDNSTLYISYSNFTVYQDYDYQYRIILEDNSTLKILYSSFNTGKINIEVKGNVSIYIENSKINTEATINGSGKIVDIRESEFYFENLFLNSALSVKNSIVSGKSVYISKSNVNISNSEIPDTYLIQGSYGRFYNSSMKIKCDSSSLAIYYGVLNLKVIDSIGNQIKNSTLIVRFFDNQTIYGVYTTDEKGSLEINLPEMLIRNYTDYIGNYNITLNENNNNFYKNIALRLDGKMTSITWILNKVVYPPIKPSKNDIYVKNKLILEGNESSYSLNGNIIVDGGTLIVRNYTIYGGNNYVIGNNATVIFENSKMDGIIYGINTTLTMHNSDAGELIFTNGNLDIMGNVNSIYSTGYISFKGFLNTINFSGNGMIEDSHIKTGIFEGNMEFRNSTVENLIVRNSNLKLINSGYSEIEEKNTKMEKYYWVHIFIRNGYNRLVPNSQIYIYKYNISSQKLLEKLNASNGIAMIYLPAVNKTSGNYMAVAYYRGKMSDETYFTLNADVNITLRFKDHIVPPFSISISYKISPKNPMTNEKVKIEGRALYENGEPVKNSTFKINIFNSEYSGKTDDNGYFTMEVLSPSKEGKYKFTIVVENKSYNITGIQEGSLNVKSEMFSYIYLSFVIGISVAIAIIVVVIAVRRKYYKVVLPS